MSSISNKKLITVTSANQVSPYLSRKCSTYHRSHSTEGSKLKTPRILPSRALFINSKNGNVPGVPNTPPVCRNSAKHVDNKNLTNLRDILRATHQPNSKNKPTHIQSASISRRLVPNKNADKDLKSQSNTLNHLRRSSQASLKDILKLADIDVEISNKLKIDSRPENSRKISQIEKDLQESLRMLKQYNHASSGESSMTASVEDRADNISLMRKSFLSSKELLRRNNANNQEIMNFNRPNHLHRNFPKLSDDRGINKSDHFKPLPRKQTEFEIDFKNRNNTQAPPENEPQYEQIQKIVSPSESILNVTATTPTTETAPMTFTNDLTTQLDNSHNHHNAEQINQSENFLTELTAQPDPTQDLTNKYWNYDELNELRMKFISLLSPDNETKNDQIQSDVTRGCGVASKLDNKTLPVLMEETTRNMSTNEETPTQKKLNPSTTPNLLQPISSIEQYKIESFYSSYGTKLYTASACACLYTLTNLKNTSSSSSSTGMYYTHSMTKSNNPNRASIAIAPNNAATKTNHTLKTTEIDIDILKDFMNNKYQNHVSVYHRGVPLWLINSGTNPRRPVKQIKFTLAEKGTGFILWQDRIDTLSDFRIYAQRKTDHKIVNYANYCDKFEVANMLGKNKLEQSEELFSTMLITFKASDKKTTVFVKFDMNLEGAKFHEFYAQMQQKEMQQVKQRTKSLPTGVNMNITNRAFNTSCNQSNYDNMNNVVVKRVKPHQSSHEMNKLKRQSLFGQMLSRQKRISKHEISTPSDLKHIINLNSNDRNSYYTLSKLLPVSVCSSLSISSSSANENSCESSKSTPSPTFSSSSASSLSFSSANARNTKTTDSSSSQQRDTWDSPTNRSSTSSLSLSPGFKANYDEPMPLNESITLSNEIISTSKTNYQLKRFEMNQRSSQKKAS